MIDRKGGGGGEPCPISIWVNNLRRLSTSISSKNLNRIWYWERMWHILKTYLGLGQIWDGWTTGRP